MNILRKLQKISFLQKGFEWSLSPSLAGRAGVGLLLFLTLPCFAQFRLNLGNDAPIRKLQAAEMAITNLYVDSV
ncbi:MAG: hypothetical protein IKV37_01200, partial [Prevotella sp.]|nr:hypothetical protein [Prevotella sp.]